MAAPKNGFNTKPGILGGGEAEPIHGKGFLGNPESYKMDGL